MRALGEPQRRFRSIHVVGTNGKSSTTRMIAAILERQGLRTGAYLSPHLRSFAERIEIGERELAPERFTAAVRRVAAAVERLDADRPPDDHVTQFEALTAAAYVELAESGVEVAIVEAGLGGRFDATSVIASEVQVLTNVGLEHTALLGATHAEIAAEKLAVVPDAGVLVVGAGLHPDAARVAGLTASRRGAKLVLADSRPSVEPALPGGFQRLNFALAEAAAEAFAGGLEPGAVREAAATVRSPGRLEIVDRAPLTVLDAAHNPHGIAALADALPELISRTGVRARGRLVAVLSILEDKDADGILRTVLPHCWTVVATSNASPRARSAEELGTMIRDLGGRLAAIEPDPVAALIEARRLARAEGVVLATGSIALVGELLTALGSATAAVPGSARAA